MKSLCSTLAVAFLFSVDPATAQIQIAPATISDSVRIAHEMHARHLDEIAGKASRAAQDKRAEGRGPKGVVEEPFTRCPLSPEAERRWLKALAEIRTASDRELAVAKPAPPERSRRTAWDGHPR